MTNVDAQSVNLGIGRYATLYLRIALAATFLTSVIDRLCKSIRLKRHSHWIEKTRLAHCFLFRIRDHSDSALQETGACESTPE